MELCDYPSERIILGGIYQYGQDAFLEVNDLLEVDSFYDETNSIIYKAYQYLFEEKGLIHLDKLSLHSAVNHLGFSHIFNDSEVIDQFKAVVNTKTTFENLRIWAIKVRKLHLTRSLQQEVGEIYKKLSNVTGDESIEEIIGLAENPILDFSNTLDNSTNEPQLISINIDDYIDYLCKNVVENPGVSTGYPLYDIAIGGGLRRKTISMMGARSKGAKSFFSINVGLHISGKLQIPILYLDTEMDREQQVCRILPNITYKLCPGTPVSINELETGKFSRSEKKLAVIKNAKEKLKDTKFYYQNISGVAPDAVLSIIRRWIYKKVGFDENGRTKDCVIIYDYVKLMDEGEIKQNISEFQRIGFIMTKLHNLAVKHDVPILGLIQLNRDGADKESVTVVSQSDRVIWLCSNFSILKNKSDEEIANDGPQHGNKKIVPLITRFGAGLQQGDYINYQFDGQYSRLVELNTKFNLLSQNIQSNIVQLDQGEVLDVDALQTTNTDTELAESSRQESESVIG